MLGTKKLFLNDLEAADGLFFQSVFRVICYLLFVSILFIRIQYGLFDYTSTPIVAIGFALLVSTAVFVSVARFLKPGTLQWWLLCLAPLADIVAITFMVNFSGGLLSKLAFLYLIPVFASVFVSLRFALVTGVVALGLFMLRSYGAEYGWWNAVEKMGYSSEQLVALNTLVLFLLLAISITGILLYIIFRLRKNQRLLEKYEDAAFSLENEFRESVAHVRSILEGIARGENLSPEEIRERANAALREVGLSTTRADAILSNLEEVSLPVTKSVCLRRKLRCSSCRDVVVFGESYYGVPFLQRKAYLFGSYRNDVHCTACHDRQTKNTGTCSLCGTWAPQVSKNPSPKTGGYRIDHSPKKKVV